MYKSQSKLAPTNMSKTRQTIIGLQTKCGNEGNHNPNSNEMNALTQETLTWTSHPEAGIRIVKAVFQCTKCLFVCVRYYYNQDDKKNTSGRSWHSSLPVIYPVNIQGQWV